MVLKLDNVFAGYDGGDVLKGVNLLVEKGGITCIVGPNGAGKSTVLRTISGLIKPRLGTITLKRPRSWLTSSDSRIRFTWPEPWRWEKK